MRVLGAGWVPVLWRDVLLANILSSLVKPLVDINHSVCFSLTVRSTRQAIRRGL